jgi:hypothetical protein
MFTDRNNNGIAAGQLDLFETCTFGARPRRIYRNMVASSRVKRHYVTTVQQHVLANDYRQI